MSGGNFPGSPVVRLHTSIHCRGVWVPAYMPCDIAKKKKRLKKCIWTLWEKARVGWSERIALKYVYYQGWNRSPVQVGCVRQVLRAGALGWPRGMGWGGRWEGGSGWETHVNPWLIHVNVWQKPLQYCKVISLQLIKIKERKKKCVWLSLFYLLSFPILLLPRYCRIVLPYYHEVEHGQMTCLDQ